MFDPNRVVDTRATTTVLRGRPAVAYGAGGSLTVTVSGINGPSIRVSALLSTTPAITATGRLQLLVDGRARVTATLAARHRNTLTLVSRPLRPGRHRLQAVFSGSPNAMDARTGVVTITVYR